LGAVQKGVNLQLQKNRIKLSTKELVSQEALLIPSLPRGLGRHLKKAEITFYGGVKRKEFVPHP
jgi:hypothetical protein